MENQHRKYFLGALLTTVALIGIHTDISYGMKSVSGRQQVQMTPEEIAQQAEIFVAAVERDNPGVRLDKDRTGTLLQPGINLLEKADDFPKMGPILIITDGGCDKLRSNVIMLFLYLLMVGFLLFRREKSLIFSRLGGR